MSRESLRPEMQWSVPQRRDHWEDMGFPREVGRRGRRIVPRPHSSGSRKGSVVRTCRSSGPVRDMEMKDQRVPRRSF